MFESNKIAFENFSLLTILKVLEMAIPITVYPYLINTLGARNYGIYVFGFSIVQYFVILTTFGFNSNAVQSISTHRFNKKSLGYVISSILTIKLIPFIVSIIAVLTYSFYFQKVNITMYLFLLGNVVFAFLMPLYYFRGIEQMRGITLISLGSKIFSVILIFLLINKKSDYYLIAALFSLGHLFSIFYAYKYIIYDSGIRLHLIGFNRLRKTINDTLPIFYSHISVTIKDRSTPILIGKLISLEAVALFDLAYKITNLTYSMISNFSGAFLPKVVRNGSKSLKMNLLIVQSLSGVFSYLFFILFGQYVVTLLGSGEMDVAYRYLLILGLIIPFYLFSNALDIFYILPAFKYKLISKSIIVSLLAYLIYLFLLLKISYDIELIIIGLVFSSLIACFYRLYWVNKLIWKSDS